MKTTKTAAKAGRTISQILGVKNFKAQQDARILALSKTFNFSAPNAIQEWVNISARICGSEQ